MQRNFKNFNIVITFCLICFFSFPLLTFGQVNVERATQGVDRSFRREAEEKLKPAPQEKPEIEEEKPAPSIGPKYFIKKIVLVGCESFPSEDFTPIIKEYENKDCSFQDIEFLAKQIEKEYLKKGVIAACFIPQQEIKEGSVILQIIEAKMGRLEIPEHPFFRKERIAYYWSIKPGESLKYDEIMRSLYFINKNPDRNARITLFAGKKPRTTDIKFDVSTTYPLHFTGSFDREGAFYSGRTRRGEGIRYNNLFGLDDTILLGHTASRHTKAMYLYHNVPITNFGTTVMYGYSYSRSMPKKDYASYGIISYYQSSSVFVHQDLFKKGEYVGEVYGGLEADDKTDLENTGTTDRDRLRNLQTGLNYQIKGDKNITYFNPEVSWGINLFGARRRSEYTTRNSKNTFTKINFNAQHKRLLPFWDIQAVVGLNSQYGCTRLPSSETFSLGGMKSVRGYPEGDARVDAAVQVNTEILFPAFFIPTIFKLPYDTQTLRDITTPLIFFDYGWGRRKPIGTERKRYNLKGIGLGIRFRLYNQVLIRLEWGYPIGDKQITEGGSARFHFSFDLEERLPEEIKKMQMTRQEDYIKAWTWEILEEELARKDSPLRKKLFTYLYIAETAQNKKDWAKAKKYYKKVISISNSLYEDVKKYITACFDAEKELKEYDQLAHTYYKEGNFIKAKEVWQDLITKAKIKPGFFNF